MTPEPKPANVAREHTREAEDGSEQLDLSALKDYVGFVFRAARRRKLLVLFTFALIVGLAKTALFLLPRSYHVETRLLAQRNQVIGALALSNRSIPEGADAPTRSAVETVLRRDNLMSLIKKTDLLNDWDRNRSPVGSFKDALLAKFGIVASENDKIEALAATLESSVSVTMDAYAGEGSITIAVDWSNAQMAFRLATAALQNFLETRHISEIDNISEAISILSGRANTVRQEIDATAMQIEASAPGVRREPGARAELPFAVAKRPRPAAASDQPSEPELAEQSIADATQLRATWEGKRTAIRDLEDIRRRRLVEAQGKLAEQRAIYADSYPTIVDTRRSIEMLTQESPQVTQLRHEEAELRREYRERTGLDPDTPTAGLSQLIQRRPGGAQGGVASPSRSSVAVASAPADTDDRAMEFLKAQLRQQIQAYDRLLERIDNARMEMETAEVAFKYRYTVLRPAQLPRAPSKPKAGLILGGGFLAGIIFAILAAALADLLSGRILERWQAQRMLDVPVIADLHMKL